jgi:hypothetical protein
VRKFSLSESRSVISSVLIWKSKTSLFCRILSSCIDFGITTKPCCKPHRIKTWADVLSYFFAASKRIGLAVLPWSMGCKLLAESYSSRRTVTDLVGIEMDGILLGSPQV